MIKLTTDQRNRLLYIALGTVAVIAVLGFVLVSPQMSSKKKIRSQIAEAKTKFQEADSLRKEKDLIQQDLDQVDAQINQIESQLAPKPSLYTWTFKVVDNFRTNYNVSITQFSNPIQSEVGSIPDFPYKAGIFKITFNAFYHNFGKFVADFENKYPYFRFQKLEMKRISVEPGKTPVAATVEDREQLEFKVELVVLISKLTE